MRLRLIAAATFAVAVSALTAHADSITYDLTLTATSDTSGVPASTFNGTGTVVLTSAPSATGLTNYGSAPVTFSIDGQSFSGTAFAVEFLNGSLYNATSQEQVGASPNRYSLQTSGTYFAFYYNNLLSEASGTITASPAPPMSVTPEPSSLALLGTGVLGVLGAARRRFAR